MRIIVVSNKPLLGIPSLLTARPTVPTVPSWQTNYRKWKYLNAMYGSDAKCITEWIKFKSSVSTDDIVDRGDHKAPRTFLVPVRMPTAIEQFLWLDLTYPLRAIYLPRQHKVDNGVYRDWCVFQHLSFRHRKLDFSAHVFSGEKEITPEERANLSIPVDGHRYKSGDEYLLDVIERLVAQSEDKESASQSLSELKKLKDKGDPNLHLALEKQLGAMCDKAKYHRNNLNKQWAADIAKVDGFIQAWIEDSKNGYEHFQDLVNGDPAKRISKGHPKYNIFENAAKKVMRSHESNRENLMARPHEDPLNPDEEKKLAEKMALYDKTIEKAREIDREMDKALRTRLKMNTYTRRPITLEHNEEYGWGVRDNWIARFDVSLIYNSTMLPRGWLSEDYQSPYCGISIFSQDSIRLPSQWKAEEREMFSNELCCDLVEVLKKEWGVRIKYDDTPVEPDFVWGLINSIAQIGLGLVPGWGPLLVYGDTLLYNLIFTDTFSKIAGGDQSSIAVISLQSVALLTGVGPGLRKLIKGDQDGSMQALMQLTMARR